MKRQRGVTLFELMVVMACIGIMAAIALPNWLRDGRQIRGLRNAARQVVADVRYGRTRSITANREYRLCFHTLSDWYCLERGDESNGSDSWVREGESRLLGELSGSGAGSIDIAGTGVDVMMFKPNGYVSAMTVTLENQTGQRIQVVCSVAGRVRLVRE